MNAKKNEDLTKIKESAFLVGVELFGQARDYSIDDSLTELTLLADTAGLDVVGSVIQKLTHPNPNTFIGSGKVEEVKALAEELRANLILFDDELSPRHLRELETRFGNNLRILDRTALILDIFAQHAATKEGFLQVELAQYEYRLPRLTNAWTHLARQAGGGGGRSGGVGGVGLRGPGETQLEVDRRDIRRRIEQIKGEIEKVRVHRQLYRTRRKKTNIPIISLVGYTNSGKSTLLNRLTNADVYVADKLFATLDPTTRRITLPGGNVVLLTDTVGFIQKLPAGLIAAFRATLEEISEADLLLHVIDLSHPNAKQQMKSVYTTLSEIRSEHIPVISVLNKIDRVADFEKSKHALENFPNSVLISALIGEGINDLLAVVQKTLYDSFLDIHVSLPYQQGGLVAEFHQHGKIDRSEQKLNCYDISGKIPGRLYAKFSPFIVRKTNEKPTPEEETM